MMHAFRLSLTLGLLLPVAACASATTGSGGGTGAPIGGGTGSNSDASASSGILPRPTAGPPTQANQAAPDSRAVNLRSVTWTRAEAGQGRQLLIYYTATGLAECSLLGRVDMVETSTAVTITVLLGQAPGANCTDVQPMIAAQFVTTVTLHEPLGTRTVQHGAR